MCFSKINIIGSDNGLSPGRRQAIIWTNTKMLLIGSMDTNFSEILIGIHIFPSRKCWFYWYYSNQANLTDTDTSHALKKQLVRLYGSMHIWLYKTYNETSTKWRKKYENFIKICSSVWWIRQVQWGAVITWSIFPRFSNQITFPLNLKKKRIFKARINHSVMEPNILQPKLDKCARLEHLHSLLNCFL